MPATIAPGAHIELRDAIWRVKQVDWTSSGTQAWRCVGISPIVRDQEAVFLEEFEPQVVVLDPRETKLERDTSSQHRAGLLYIESLLRDVPPPDDALYVGHRAAMDVIDFQLDPAWLALQKPRQRILIADSVGLGKTLEAGILLSELIRRGRARRILVAVTKAMLTQFQKEMWARFSIPLVRLDSLGLQRIRADIPTHQNPFYHFDKTIISIDTLKQDNWFRDHLEKAEWDVVVIDEAHNVATRGNKQAMRAKVAEKLAGQCDSLILLSATPHDGRAESFASLMLMLDPTAIANRKAYTREDIQGLYVRRFKAEVKDQLARHIPERKVLEAHADATPEEEAAFDVLTALRLPALDADETGGILFRTGLTKALFSSPRACISQLRAPLRRKRIFDALPKVLRERLLDPKRTRTSDALTAAAVHLAGDPLATDLLALRDLAVVVEAIPDAAFSRYGKLIETLDRLGWKPRTAREDRLVIFTERRETLLFLQERLVVDLGLAEGQCEILHGGLSDIEQQRIVEDFGKSQAKVRVLLATDVASEGLNLHYLCHRLVHFDMPWSLMVFQQRNGRVDRYGQESAPQIVYLQTDAVNPSIRGDTRILELLRIKSNQAETNIGDPSAFMNVYDVEEEERITAEAIQAGLTVEAFEQQLGDSIDPFAFLYEDAATTTTPSQPAPTRSLPSLFASDFDYFVTGIDRLTEQSRVKARVDKKERLIELHIGKTDDPDTGKMEDLRRRFRRFPREIRPADGVLLVTADPARMQEALADARKEEDAWPRHQYLWANSPLIEWMNDRVRAAFGRHTAPVLVVPGLAHVSPLPLAGEGGAERRVRAEDRTAVIVSGLLPNRRGQPLVHRWYVAIFDGNRIAGIQSFEAFQAATGLGRTLLPNANQALDLTQLARLLKPAVDAVEQQVRADREAFRARTDPRLAEELARLDRLQERQLRFVFECYADPISIHRREQKEKDVRKVFRKYQHWIEESMTTADQPFLQVVAVLVGGRS